jgi:hypothetical protein
MKGGRRALLGCVAVGWLAGLGILAGLTFGGASCGPAFSLGAGASDGGPAMDVVTVYEAATAEAGGNDAGGSAGDAGDAGGGAGGNDASVAFCASVADAGHTLCEDFSDLPFPGKFKFGGTNTGTVAFDQTLMRSPPGSALATLLAQGAGSVGTALITHQFLVADGVGTRFTLSDWVRFDSSSDCFPSATQGVAIAAIVFPNATSHYAIDILQLLDNVEIVESTTPADGGAAVLTPHFVAVGALCENAFCPWTVDVSLGLVQKTATITVNDTQGPTQSLTGAPAAAQDYTTPTLLLGASVTGATTWCKVNIDDILFDIRATTAM